MIYGARTVKISLMEDSASAWIFKSIGLDKSKLKIPMIDFASMTYLPEVEINIELGQIVYKRFYFINRV